MSYNSKYKGTEVESLLDKVDDMGEIPTKVSQLENDAGYLTSHQDISGKLDKTEAASTYLSKTEASSTYLGKTAKAADATKADSATKATQDGNGNNIVNTYATKNELNGKGTYSKPSTGIPKSDLASAVQTSLNKADTALQSHQDISGKQDKLVSGTNIKTINGESILGSGDITVSGGGSSDIYVLEVGYVESGVVSAEEFERIRQCKTLVLSFYSGLMTIVLQLKLDFGTELTFATGICTPPTVMGYSVTFNIKEDGSAEWSLTNIQQYFKTINGESIFGEEEGDIVIEGGGSSSGGSGTYAEVNHGTNDTTFALTPNTFHVWDEVASLDLSFSDEQVGVANEYLFQFTSGATATTLTLPDVKWANDSAPTIAENMIYQISVLNGLASVLEFNNAVELIDNKAILTNAQDGEVTFQYPVASTITVSVRGDMIDSIIFNAGEQTKSASESSFGGYTIVSVTPNKDNIYNYIF